MMARSVSTRPPIHRLFPLRAIICWIVLLACAQSLAADDAVREVRELIERDRLEQAVEQAQQSLDENRDQPELWFEKARALTQLDRLDDAASALEQAVRAGYRDFSRMRTDSALVPLRTHEAFRAIDRAARRADPNRGRVAYEKWIEQHGRESYRYEEDQARRLLYATALDEVAHREMRRMIEQLADHLAGTLFEAAPDDEVLVAVPTPRDAHALLPDVNVGGLYEHRSRRLIARDIGSALRHEFVHVMHYGHMERIGQIHPLWVQEGLASLFEDYEFTPDGAVRFLPNERHTIARRNLRAGQIIPWREMFSLSADRFMIRSAVGYAQARSIFEFVAARGKLEAWYDSYVRHFHSDPAGVAAFEEVFEMSLPRIEQEWQRWLRQRPDVPLHLQPGDASLGVETMPNAANDGVQIMRILPNSAAAIAGLEVGDVIVSVNGRSARTIEELRRIISSHRVSDLVHVRIRRGGKHQTVEVELRALRM